MNTSGMDPAGAMLDQEPMVGGATSFIDPASSVEGTIRTERDLRVEGTVTGKVFCDGVLMVAEGATVDAEIEAASIIVAGEMSGTVRCRGRLEIRSTGMVRGDVTTGALVIVEGARYEGQIAMDASGGGATIAPPPTEIRQDIEPEYTGSESESYSFLRRFTSEDASVEDEREFDEEES
jgi:cytoskeletal protein CcmA (bactofilin family)